MLPVPANASPAAAKRKVSTKESEKASKRACRYATYALAAVFALYGLRFLYSKCDTRSQMSELLTKTTQILQRNNVEYWLDKGTLLGVHRDHGLIPWEYDVDLGVMNTTCAEISALKSEFAQVGLTAYDRSDYIPHKVKLTYDTENHHFYWSDGYMHDPCIRVYDTLDVSTWVDIYWYVELDVREVGAQHERVLIPPGYDWNSSLICCSEGMLNHTEHMCCGGCVPKDTLFPLQKQHVPVTDGVDPVQAQYVPNQVAQFLSIQYGPNALKSREIKGWKGVVCGFWTSPFLFALHLMALNGVLVFLVMLYRRRRADQRRSKRRNM
ncbi:hypothetical protein Poli38472_003111 [Pythium oligandrum]|uniref:LicD/FKTN/FKRP nucleotidyltransferase domain-containing protein n=1 Tax=Pythium oligandrum TaxID=41045 RepID=A0A8K1C5Y1_PYTOL|nr:hypothetical protein Poli38472_003111 [Pythium oligandrum]|eukprot:TMW57186.1 hypothetical protein Poli38472_003111 [Pythium oligandrum]